MRVTFVLAAMDLSGGSRIIATYASRLAARGHTVTVVAPLPRRLRFTRKVRDWLATGRWHESAPGRSHYDGLGLDVRRIEHGPVTAADVPDADVVIATWWETAEWVDRLPASKGAKVYFVQGHEVFDVEAIERVRATYHMPFTKIVVSGWLQRIMAETYGDHDTLLVPNSVDRGVFHAEPRGRQAVPTLGFMYARNLLKGADIAAATIRRVRQTHPDLRVLSFGTTRPLDAEGIEPLEFLHRPSPEELRRTYASCDVWLCCSRSEGFGLPAMEAMSCRTPLVSTRVGWPLDAIEDGVNGYLVDIGDADAMAEAALKCLRQDDAAWRAMSERAHATAGMYHWERSHELFERALEIARDKVLTARA